MSHCCYLIVILLDKYNVAKEGKKKILNLCFRHKMNTGTLWNAANLEHKVHLVGKKLTNIKKSLVEN